MRTKKNPKGEIQDQHLETLAGDVDKSRQLAAYVAIIEKIELEIQELGRRKKGLYNEMRAMDFCYKTVRHIALDRVYKKDRFASNTELLRLYEDIVDTHKKG